MPTAITTHVSAINQAFQAITYELNEVAERDGCTSAEYQLLESDLLALETAVNSHATIAAIVTVLAQRSNAAHSVGSTHVVDYLTKKFGLSRTEAFNRINLAATMFPPEEESIEEEKPAPQPETKKNSKKEKAPPKSGKRKQQEQISAEKHAIITQELQNLNPHTSPTKQELFDQALSQARWRIPEDLRTWIRTEVRRINASNPDPITSLEKRYLALSQPDANNMVRVHGLIPAATAALIKANMSPLTKRGDLVDVLPSDDIRSSGQRHADALHHIMTLYNQGIIAKNNAGIGSIVISMTTDDLDILNITDAQGLSTLYPTNTGYRLNLAEIMNLVAARYDFAVLLNGKTGQALNVGRMKRSATLEQRVALFASELVCSAPDCERPQLECDIHHLDPWIRGGLTNLKNLTQQCFNHHPRNDDTRSGTNGKGYMDRDSSSDRVGHYPAQGTGPEFNNTAAHESSGGAWARQKHQRGSPPGWIAKKRQSSATPWPDDGGLFHHPA